MVGWTRILLQCRKITKGRPKLHVYQRHAERLTLHNLLRCLKTFLCHIYFLVPSKDICSLFFILKLWLVFSVFNLMDLLFFGFFQFDSVFIWLPHIIVFNTRLKSSAGRGFSCLSSTPAPIWKSPVDSPTILTLSIFCYI